MSVNMSISMSVGLFSSRTLWRSLFALMMAASIFSLSWMGVMAQEEDSNAQVSEMASVADADESSTVAEIATYREISAPPLPFRQPQVGPEVKRAFADDVDRRTTSFIPDEDLPIDGDFEIPVDEKWIRIDLGRQQVYAYDGSRLVRGFIISSGLPRTPTVTGEFRIRVKVSSQTMSGGSPEFNNDYYLPNVQWVQYFHEDYGLHGTYWHNNFGNPMSHGCVNMTNADAKWLFDWAGPVWDGKTVWQRSTQENEGTIVYVHE